MKIKFDITITEENGEPCKEVQISSFTIYAPLKEEMQAPYLPPTTLVKFHKMNPFRLMEYITSVLHELHAQNDFIEGFGECLDWEVIEKQYINFVKSSPDEPDVRIHPFPFHMPASIRKIKKPKSA